MRWSAREASQARTAYRPGGGLGVDVSASEQGYEPLFEGLRLAGLRV